MTHGHEVEPSALTDAAAVIWEALSGTDRLDLEGVIGDSAWYGHDGVYQAIKNFAGTWSLATKLLAKDADESGHRLEDAASGYGDTDDAVERMFKKFNQPTGIAPEYPGEL